MAHEPQNAVLEAGKGKTKTKTLSPRATGKEYQSGFLAGEARIGLLTSGTVR